VGILFLSTTKIEEFAYALTRVGMPYKLGFAMTLAFRLVPVFLDAAVTVAQAQRCRGFNFDEGNIFASVCGATSRSLCPSSWARCVAPTVWRWHSKRAVFQSQRQRTSYEQSRSAAATPSP